MNRRIAHLLPLTLVVVGVAVALWLSRDDDAAATPVDAEEASAAAVGPRVHVASTSAAPATEDERVDPEVIARPSCFSDVLAIDRVSSLEGIKQAFEQGMAEDPMLAEYLEERLAELIGDSAALALEVLAWAKGAPAGDAEILLAGLSRSKGAKDPRVAEGLLALSENADASESARLAAVDALRSQPSLDEEGRGRLKKLALEGASEDLSWRATRALGSVMTEVVKEGGDFKPYWDELMEVAATSTDPAARALALEANAYSDPILPRSSIAQLTELMLNEPDRDVRELAAFQLGLTESPAEALEAFRRAFVLEYDECVRWAIVRFAVRAAGADALPLLAWFAEQDPAFVADYEDFRTLFAAGYQDFEQIWLNKPERHACVVEDGHIHGG